MKFLFSIFLSYFFISLKAQFPGGVGQSGCTAIYKDSIALKGWATKCKIIRGLQDISAPGAGYANVGDSTSALGIAGTTGIVSLGDGGEAILQFNGYIKDGVGPDFAVFENGFNDSFLELAFVEVSSDGVNYFRFPAVSNTDTTVQTGSFAFTDPTKINNLAGKYRVNYGTPFDMADIANHILLNKQAITHVKIKDVVGCIQNQYATRDFNGHKVNDPWPTAFGSSGFDLDAVGVIYLEGSINNINENDFSFANFYPNPVAEILYVDTDKMNTYTISIANFLGSIVLTEKYTTINFNVSLAELPNGVYTLTIRSAEKQMQQKIIKQ